MSSMETRIGNDDDDDRERNKERIEELHVGTETSLKQSRIIPLDG